MQSSLFRNKRLVVALIIAIFIAAVFWSQSRIPALNEKAQMGLRTNFSSIAFDILLPVLPDQPTVERVARSTINWLYTNWKGMSFGLLFAAIALTILGLVKHRSFKRAWMNTLSGMFVGAPLGVCVNCATPIAQGMYAAGARLETALATLISSPSLNVIVLSMSFTLLPWEIAAANVVAVLWLLALLPVLVRTSSAPPLSAARASGDYATSSMLKPPPSSPPAGPESYADAIAVVSRQYAKSLFYIVKLAVPLMLLAGILGAIVIELAPFSRLTDIEPTIVVLVVTAVIATFLPVPMAFNVIVVMALLASGMEPALGAVLLFTLSVYSIYPATIIAKFISPKLSVALATAVILLGTALGLASKSYFNYQQVENQKVIEQGLIVARDKVYRSIATVCESVPQHLQTACVANQLRTTRNVIPHQDLCRAAPEYIPMQGCHEFVALLESEEFSLAKSSSEVCDELPVPGLRRQCFRFYALQMALRHHDIGQCDQLNADEVIKACRVQYLNESLLFNPDASVCKGLSDHEYFVCDVNARIYRIADTLNISSCDDVTPDARTHCRWVTASNMVGRNNDTSGCLHLQSAELRLRCQEQVVAWQATRDQSFEACEVLQSEGLSDTCILKVAGRKIATILADYSLGQPVGQFGDFHSSVESGPQGASTDTGSPSLQWHPVLETSDLEISYTDYQERPSANIGGKAFKKIAAADVGISKSWDFRIVDFFEPFIIGKGIASGDINNDLWPDIVLASEHGALFYKNVGGRFEMINVDQGDLKKESLFLVALVDVDNDGNQDLFASAYGGQNYLLLNLNNRFEESSLVRLESEQRLSLSAGFGDIDNDNDLDIVLGNWSSGVEKLFSAEESANQLLLRDGDSYRVEPINDVKGETNSVLIADANGDGVTDLLFGNDRIVPDIYYFGTEEHQLSSVTRDRDVIPQTPMFTMSIDSADFNNDLRPDLFSTDMTFARSSGVMYCDAVEKGEERSRCLEVLAAYDAFSTGGAISCKDMATQRDTSECYVAHSIKAAKSLKDPSYCENVPADSTALHSLCIHVSAPIPAEQQYNQDDFLPQVQRNMLLLNNGTSFGDNTLAFGVESSFWSWNAKAADLDNDGWQDIYVGNGFHFGDSFYEVQPNVLFRNIEGKAFEESAADWGLDDTINTPSYTYIDFDLDGDIDIVATGVLAAPRVFVNQQTKNNSITFSLRDDTTNTFAIGAKVMIAYGDSQQQKEIKLSGGFMSFDNPVAHFGIASFDSIDRMTVTWPDGQVTEYSDTLPANRYYRIRRKAPGDQ